MRQQLRTLRAENERLREDNEDLRASARGWLRLYEDALEERAKEPVVLKTERVATSQVQRPTPQPRADVSGK